MAKDNLADRLRADYKSLPRTRAEAKAAKSVHYFTGVPCGNGHLSPRYASIKRCVACQNEAMQRVVDKDPVLAKAKLRRRLEANKEHIRARTKEWYARTSEVRRVYTKQREERLNGHVQAVKKTWASKNPEKVRAYQKKRNIKDKEKVADRVRIYKLNNRHRYASFQKARQTLQMNAMPSWVDRREIDAVYAEASRLTCSTGIKHSVDHIYPLKGKTFCGLHVPWNLQVLTLRENIQKGNKHPDEWVGTGG